MMFTFPGSKAPSSWDPARKGMLQHGAGLQTVSQVTLTLPFEVMPSAALVNIAERCSPILIVQQGARYGLELVLEGEGGTVRCELGG
jgi:hypothetical protein